MTSNVVATMQMQPCKCNHANATMQIQPHNHATTQPRNHATTQQCNHANNDITYVTAVNIGAPVTPNANAKTIVLIMPIATVIPNII